MKRPFMRICPNGKIRIIFILLFISFSVLARERPKIGLALSGGGAKGFAHIGVLKVLEEIDMPIDYIAGTSMGSVIGGLYAIGYRANDLEKLALNTDWNELFSDYVPRRALGMEQKIWEGRYTVTLAIHDGRIQLPSGLIAGQKITSLLDRLTLPVQHIENFKELPIPFVCVATDIVTGKAVVLDHGHLPEAIRASMSIPSIFTPIKLGNKLLVDGGIVRNFPVEDCRNLGADLVIGVDVTAPLHDRKDLNSLLTIMDQAASFQIVASTKKQRELCDYLLIPDMGEYSTFDFDQAAFFISQGEKAAREKLPRLKSLADSLNKDAVPPARPMPLLVDSVYIKDLVTEGLHYVSKRLVTAELDVNYPGWVRIPELEKGIERIYSTQLFERVSYRLEPIGRNTKLIIKLVEKSDDLFRVSIRYDSKRDAALLLNTTFRNLIKFGSYLTFDFKLGGDPELDTQYFIHTGLLKHVGFRLRGYYARTSLDIYDGELRIARYRQVSTIGEGILGSIFSTKFALGIGLRGEYVRGEPSIAPPNFKDRNEELYTAIQFLTIDTYDRSVFPASGVFIQLMNEAADQRFGSSASFRRHYLDLRSLIPLHPRISLLQNIFLGTSSGNEIPVHYQFALGGMDFPITFFGKPASFLGLKAQERLGHHVQFLQAGIQYEIFDRKYILLRWNAGNTFDQWKINFDPDRFITGAGVTLGMESPLGPIEFTMMGGSRHDFLTYLNLGYKF